ncbi:hypothetical protein [Corynebacterium sp. AOP12-C2-36]|uniref:hypothetical protein n=1 Tax=Corynebacterium sp. AOP12-C2-36 TaxID=3457723 RepID=UPI0040335129
MSNDSTTPAFRTADRLRATAADVEAHAKHDYLGDLREDTLLNNIGHLQDLLAEAAKALRAAADELPENTNN